MGIKDDAYRARVFDLVREIPPGRVMTYGQIAILLGEGYTARTVGSVMGTSPDDVPWHRVINSQGRCSTGRITIPIDLQRELLETEGVVFKPSGRCDLDQYRWMEAASTDDDNDEMTLFTRKPILKA